MKKYLQTISMMFLVPFVALAQLGGTQSFITSLMDIVKLLITLAAMCALLVFMWGLVKFIFKLGSEADIEGGKNLMKWGLVALFVMVSVWGIIRFIQGELGLTNGSPFEITDILKG